MTTAILPVFSSTEIEGLARSLYGLETRASVLPGYSGQNARLETGDGERFVFKIAAPVETGKGLELQNRALEHLGRVGPDLGLAIPRLVQTSAGEEIARLASAGVPEARARLLTWVPGRPWAEVREPSMALHRDLGRRLGRLDLHLATFSHPAIRRRLEWDLRYAGALRSFIVEVESPRRRELAEAFFHLFAATAEPRFGELRTSVIHGDANDHNLLVDDRGEVVTGILDFEDVAETLTVCEPAIAIAYLMLGRAEPLRAAAEMVRGYHEIHPLTELEVDLLFPLASARVAFSVVSAARRRREGRTEPYLFVTEEPGWELLERLAEIDPAEARGIFRSACGYELEIAGVEPEDLMAERRRRIGPSLSVSYDQPLKIVRGVGQYLFDHRGRPYLDLVNNVCHVGHCHPRVVEAAGRQMAGLNTNTRYLHDGLTEYAQRLCATLPEPLSVCYFVCSGSEANELALRLARTHTGRRGMLVLEGAYHGHTSALIELSPYKFLGKGGAGVPEPWVHTIPVPDGYRGPHKGGGPESGALYAAEAGRAIERAGATIAAFIGESLVGCGGQIIPPEGYLEGVYHLVREAGGVCIADEVQVGFGRVGSHFWAFETQGVVPDVVVLGKPIGNGHPMSAVITTPGIAESFDNGMEFFSTFGGNPVSCAIGMAVLDVIEEEDLQATALRLGGRMLEGLESLRDRHELIGDVRGLGLFIGIELVRDRETLEPADREALGVVEAMKERGILLAIDGPLHNVLKIKPPMVLTEDDVDFTLRSLDRVLEKLAGRKAAK